MGLVEDVSEVRNFDKDILMVSTNSSSLGSAYLVLASGLSSDGGGSNDFLAFLDQLPMKVSDTIDEMRTTNTTLPVEVPQPGLAPARIGSVSLEPMVELVQPKKRPVLKEKIPLPPITLPSYMLVEEEVGAFFSCYIHESDMTNRLSWLLISNIPKPKHCLVTLSTVWLDVTPPPQFIFMNREWMNRDIFYMYDWLFHDLHVRDPFDDFTIGVL